MGKATGFLEYNRENNPAQSPEERCKHYREFHPQMTEEERKKQAARCMNCGVPFCQSAMKLNGMVSGCPLHNLIPEWNDEIYNDNYEQALLRLRKTNNFPEFTGRVCPALCEAACTCGLYGSPVTVKENELSIIENGFKNGLMVPIIPKVRSGKKIAVIGSGPSGLACADRLNQRGHEVTVYEKEDRFGGLLMYGIPNMKLEKEIVERRINLMKEEGIAFIPNANVGVDIKAKELLSKYDAVVLCCGAETPRDLKVEGREAKNVFFAVDFLKSTTKALLNDTYSKGDYINSKGKNVVIVGGGDTGNDCVGTCIRQGCKSVIQLEMMPKPPEERTPDNAWPQWPKTCKTDYGQEESIALFGHDPREYNTTVNKLIKNKDGSLSGVEIVKVESVVDKATGKRTMKQVEGTKKVINADMLIIAAGFLGPQEYVSKCFKVDTDARTNVKTADESFKTNVEKVFVAGDMHRGQSLVVWAIAEGRAAAKQVDEFLMGYTNLL